MTISAAGNLLGLNKKQIDFAVAYTSGEYAHDATHTYLNIYFKGEVSHIGTAESNGPKLRKHPGVTALIEIIYAGAGLSTSKVDLELAAALTQNFDPKAKVLAARLIYEATGKLNNELKITINHGIDLTKLTDEELEILYKIHEKAGIKNIEDNNPD